MVYSNKHSMVKYLLATKLYSMRGLQILVSMLAMLILATCDQTPTTFDKEAYLGDSSEMSFAVDISRLEFDFLSQQFFFSVDVISPLAIDQVTYTLGTSNTPAIPTLLNDLGQDADILIGDGRYDGGWRLPDSMSTYIDSLWTLEVVVNDIAANQLLETRQLQPERPAAPVISSASHLDTLTLLANEFVLDTLTLKVSHPGGLDEIRDVSMISLKPDGSYANGGQPIPLYDDGGTVVFYSFGGIDFTSGDSLANDGVYSLLLALSPSNLSGVYHWTFNARSWLGIEALPVLDSIVVLPAGSLARSNSANTDLSGVFN